jgi:type IV secretory pathway VirB2 component (pilin)
MTLTTSERDRLRRALDVSVDQAPPPPDWGTWDAAHLTPHRRRLGGPAVAVVAAIAVIVIGGATALLRATPDTATGNIETWSDWYQTAAARSIPIEGHPTLLQGALGPEPRFDTGALGVEQAIEPVDTGPDAVPWQTIIAGHEDLHPADPIVLVGEIRSTFLNAPVRAAVAVVEADHEGSAGTEPSVGFLVAQTDLTGEWASSLSSVPSSLETSFDGATLWVGLGSGKDSIAVAAPPETAVAALETPLERLWQRPRGNVAFFSLDDLTVVTITFYGSSGDILGHVETDLGPR